MVDSRSIRFVNRVFPFLLRFSNIGLLFLLNVFVALVLPVGDAAEFYVVQSLASLVAMLGHLGLRVGGIKMIVNTKERTSSPSEIGEITRTCVFIITVGCFALSLVNALCFAIANNRAHQIPLYAYYFLIFGLQQNIPELLRAFQRHNLAGLFNGVITNSAAVASLVLAKSLGVSIRLETFIWIASLAGTFSVGAALCFLLRNFLIFKPLIKDPTQLVKSAIPYLLIGVASLSFTIVDTIIVSLFSTDGQTAAYGLAAKLAAFVSVPAQITVSIAMPIVAKEFANEACVEKKALDRIFLPSRVAAICLAMVFTIAGGRILERFFGPSFTVGFWPLIVLSLFHLQSSFFTSESIVLQMSNLQQLLLRVSIFYAFVAILLQSVFCYVFGAIGASVATLIVGVSFNLTQKNIVCAKKLLSRI